MSIAKRRQQIDALADRLDVLEGTYGFEQRHWRMCSRLFYQLRDDPLEVEAWSEMISLWLGGNRFSIPAPTDAVILDDCIIRYSEFVDAHKAFLEGQHGTISFNDILIWAENSLAWARFWAVRSPDPQHRVEQAELCRMIEDDLGRCANRVREIWRKQGLHPVWKEGEWVPVRVAK